MRPHTEKKIVTLLSAIEKKKALGKKLREEKAKRERLVQKEMKRMEEKKETMNKEKNIKTLKEELRNINLENAKYVHRVDLEHKFLYNTKKEIQDMVERKDDERYKLVCELDDIFLENVKREVGQLSYCWYEDPESGDPFEAVYGILFDGCVPEEGEFFPEEEDFPCFFIRINGKGEIIEESTSGDWIQLSEAHERLGFITVHAK